MPLYLCGQAALDVMRYLRSTGTGAIDGRVPRPRRLRGAVHTNRGLNELSHSAQLMLSHVRGSIEALVPSRNQITRTSRLVTRLWCGELPSASFVDLGNGIYLSSPPFLFMQLACELDELELIALGFELCGFYSRWKLSDVGFGRPYDEETGGTTYEILPATTRERIEMFLRHAEGLRGAAKARRALSRVANNSASPTETAVYLLLTLPRQWGGFALPRPVFNAEVRVSTSTTHESRYPDLYWPERSLDVEYQSDFAHTGNWARYRDSRREVELEAEYITVLPLTRAQLYDVEQFQSFATSVRRQLGKRSRTLTPEWHDRHLSLRELLLQGDAESLTSQAIE
jgi:hypothetical protein